MSAAAGQWKTVEKKSKPKASAGKSPIKAPGRLRTAPRQLTPAQIARFTPFIKTMRKYSVNLEAKLTRVAGLYKKANPKLIESFHTTMTAAVALKLVSRKNIKTDGGGSLVLLCDDWFPQAPATLKLSSRKARASSSKNLISADSWHILFLKHALQKGLSPRFKGELYQHLYQFFRPAAGENVDDVLFSLAQLGVTTETDWWSRGAAERALADHNLTRVQQSNRHVAFLRHALATNLKTASRSKLNERLYQFFKPGGQDNLRDVWTRLEELGVTTEDGHKWHADAARRALKQIDGNGSATGNASTSRGLFRESSAAFMNINLKMLQFMNVRTGGHLERLPIKRAVWNTWFDAWKMQAGVDNAKRASILGNMAKLGALERKLEGDLIWHHDVIRTYLGQAPMNTQYSFNTAYTSFLSFVLVNMSSFTTAEELKLGIQVFLWKLQTDTGQDTGGQMSSILSQLSVDGVSWVSPTTEAFNWSLDAASNSLLTVALEVLGVIDEDESWIDGVSAAGTSVTSNSMSPIGSPAGSMYPRITESFSPATQQKKSNSENMTDGWMIGSTLSPVTNPVPNVSGLSLNDHAAATSNARVGAGTIPTTIAQSVSVSSPQVMAAAAPAHPYTVSADMFQMPMLTPQQRQETANR